MSYAHLSQEERYQIRWLRKGGWSLEGIAAELQRATSTISRELRRNGTQEGTYDHRYAQRQAVYRRHAASALPRIDAQAWATVEAHPHQDVFGHLLRMACKDHYAVVSMDPEWSRPRNIPDSAKRRYYELFRIVGVTQLQSYDGCRAQLSVWSAGIGGSGDYKDYQYMPERVENLMPSLDHLKLDDNITFYYRKIAPNWYIRYAHWP